MDKIRAQKLFPCRKPSSHYVTVIFPTDARWRELGEKIYISALISSSSLSLKRIGVREEVSRNSGESPFKQWAGLHELMIASFPPETGPPFPPILP